MIKASQTRTSDPPCKHRNAPCKHQNEDSVVDSEETNDSTNDKPCIGSIHQAPMFMRGNRYILSGYRINHSTYSDALWSLFTVHNESVNVWSHFIGVQLFVGMIFYLCCYKEENLWNPVNVIFDMFRTQEGFQFELEPQAIPIRINSDVPTCKLSLLHLNVKGPLYLHSFCTLSMMFFSAWYHLNACQSE